MSHKTIVVLVLSLIGVVISVACGPKCMVVLSKKTPDVMARDDVLRVNAYVDARKAAIAAAKKGSAYDVEKAKFTVTACELAVQIQMRIIALAEAGGALYDDNLKELNEARCLLDEILEKKGKVVGLKIGKGVFIKKGKGQEILDVHTALEEKFGEKGRARDRELETIYENGLKPPKVGKKGEEEKGGAEAGPDESLEEDMDMGGGEESTGEEGAGEEGGGEEDKDEGSDGAIDVF
jgi:hypothetical protein